MILRRKNYFERVLLFGLVLLLAARCEAADGAAKSKAPQEPRIDIISVTIHPAALPKPTLKYHLLPTFLDRTPGSAIPCYLKALMRHLEIWRGLAEQAAGKESDLDHLVSWLEMPLDKLPRDKVRKLVDLYGGTVASQLSLAVHCERCEWDLPLRQGRIFEMLLPEVQEFRNVARVVALRARLQIAEGKYAEAIASLQVGYGMARHIAEQPFLVSGLVGATIANMMSDQLLTLIQQPGVPNLYWTITELPHPLIDPVKSVDAEYDGLYLQYPELAAARHAKYAPEQWDLILRRFVVDAVRYGSTFKRAKVSKEDQAAEVAKIISHALGAIPKAKADLLAGGYTQQELNAMPPAQVVMLHALHQYEIFRDEMFQWWHVPYWLAQKGLGALEPRLADATKHEPIPAASMLLPGGSANAMFRFARTDRQLAALRCIEALRLYAAEHEGRLPATLDEVKVVPIPNNPATGEPFGYCLEGQTGVIDVNGGPATTPRIQYRVTVAK